MSKADLHVHSIYSEHPSDWFLQRLGAGESYTDPLFIYNKMKQRGMDFVTITDHNRIDGAVLLKEKYPDDVFISVESTTYFPEDNCKAHILIYDITPVQFEIIEQQRTNIYALRDYLQQENIAHSVAHATYSVNGMLKLVHLEKLLLLFDVFEVINGGRNPINNLSWQKVLENLTPSKIQELQEKHNIKPYSESPWLKGITGGSDDHAGIFLGKTYTEAHCESKKDFIDAIRNQKTTACGRHNDYKSLAFMVYKIAIEFSRSKAASLETSVFSELTDLIYDGKPFSFQNRLKFTDNKFFQIPGHSKNDNYVRKIFGELINGLHQFQDSERDVRLEFTFNKLARIVDAYFNMLFSSFEKNIRNADLLKLVRNISSSLPGIFLTLPFFSTLKVMFSSREIINDMELAFGTADFSKHGQILWFTDTIADLNGVSASLQKVITLSRLKDMPIKVVSAAGMNTDEPNYIDLPVMHSFQLPYYENQSLIIPSPLRAIDIISKLDPCKIIISTPGPVGLLGLLAARLFNIPCIGVYHTDYKAQLTHIMKEESMSKTLGKAVIWFYSQMDEVFAPSQAYVDIIASRGIERRKIRLLPRGVDFSVFDFNAAAAVKIRAKFELPKDFLLIYTGRLSDDKNLETILKAQIEINKSRSDVYLLLVGDGPQREYYQKKYLSDHIIFTGKIERHLLPEYLSAADLFLFPSNSDTFGMSVLEAQACKLPALVTAHGGPQEIICNEETGFIIRDLNPESWKDKIIELSKWKIEEPEQYQKFRNTCRERALSTAGWDKFFAAFLN
ncbi:MAG: glycosyltransferase [Candidatus Cloacimonetes bacterium]|nr:glycosyltransferase [Candidatus Cloacimonadota bacterium]